ncbi:MAG: InlB B-repeat-containing protein [Candidatus Izemoplasmatales bacterium]|nr:InlB B-repeat-containing protein [Candidatus Izemoplasmatales bacterium]
MGCTSTTTLETTTTLTLSTLEDTTTMNLEFTINYYEVQEMILLGNNELSEGELVVAIILGGSHSFARTNKDRYFAWGNNNNGQLGDGTTEDRLTPVEITDSFPLEAGEKINYFVAGDKHSGAITNLGRVFTWGWNFTGRLGDGTSTQRINPTDITENFSLDTGDKIIFLTMGMQTSAAISSSGRIYTWGANSSGQLGDGTIFNKTLPTDITANFNTDTDEKVVFISLGYVHSAALTNQGRVFTWGNNAYGQLGDGTNSFRVNPVDITENFSFANDEWAMEIDLGENFTILFTNKSNLYTFGLNDKGQLGSGNTDNTPTPLNINNQFTLQAEDKIIRISSGRSHSSFITSNYRVFIWGDNEFGQLGNGSFVMRNSPYEITNRLMLNAGETIYSISLSSGSSSLVTSLGQLKIWGNNDNGQLGNDSTNTSSLPIDIVNKNRESILRETQDFHVGETIDLYEDERTGYVFSGWYTSEDLSTLFTSTVMPGEDVNLYGKWDYEN